MLAENGAVLRNQRRKKKIMGHSQLARVDAPRRQPAIKKSSAQAWGMRRGGSPPFQALLVEEMALFQSQAAGQEAWTFVLARGREGRVAQKLSRGWSRTRGMAFKKGRHKPE